jgi:hypothetical protein
LSKQAYWNRIVEYYYDNIHWATENPPSIYQWLKSEYHADASLYSNHLRFHREADRNWFLMRWGFEEVQLQS